LRLILTSLAAAAALTACAEQTPQAPAEEAPSPSPASSAAPAEPRTPPSSGPETPATPAPADACGAAERQGWIGRARPDLPSPPAGALWRIYETGQPVTQDFRPERLNIEIDPERQTVVRLSCG
jgi:hypothetical protein